MHDEQQYLSLIREILDCGVCRGDRTGTGTLALFGRQTRWDLRTSFPLLTTKRVFWRGVAEELLWFVAGATDASLLQAKNVASPQRQRHRAALFLLTVRRAGAYLGRQRLARISRLGWLEGAAAFSVQRWLVC